MKAKALVSLCMASVLTFALPASALAAEAAADAPETAQTEEEPAGDAAGTAEEADAKRMLQRKVLRRACWRKTRRK